MQEILLVNLSLIFGLISTFFVVHSIRKIYREINFGYFFIVAGFLILIFSTISSQSFGGVVKTIINFGFLSIIIGVSYLVLSTVFYYSYIKNRYLEILDILKSLENKFIKKQISLEEFNALRKEFIKELSEIEIKIKKIKSDQSFENLKF